MGVHLKFNPLTITIMNNNQVINAFVCGKCGRSSNGNLRSVGDKLFNYYTCIAQRTAKGIIFNGTKYSVSTSKIQTWTLHALILNGFKCREVTNVPMGATDLTRF